MVKLTPSAGHPWVVAGLYAQRGTVAELVSGLVELAVADEGEPRQDQRLRARPAFGQPAVDEQLVGALLRHQPPALAVSRPGVRICGRISGFVAPGAYQR